MQSDPDVQARLHDNRGDARGNGAVGVAELDHAAVRERLSAYREGSVSDGERERIGEHLADCASCAAFANTLDRTVDLLGQLPARQLPDGRKRAILDGLRAGARG